MNILLWVLQVLLALYNVAGGMYTMGHYKILAYISLVNALPKPVWMALGLLQVLFAIGLVLPGVVRRLPKLIPISAIGLAIISLLGSALFVTYGGFPGILWAIVPALLLFFVAYGRWSTK